MMVDQLFPDAFVQVLGLGELFGQPVDGVAVLLLLPCCCCKTLSAT